MREILFKGKGTCGLNAGDWIYGYYVKDFWKPTRCGCGIIPIDKERGGYCEVDPSTICQYTGSTDKNGKKIFEGDIVKYKNTDGVKVNGVALTVIGKVNYNEKNASFAIDGKDKIGAKYYDYFPIKNIEVIGNVFDNPELLKDAEQEWADDWKKLIVSSVGTQHQERKEAEQE